MVTLGRSKFTLYPTSCSNASVFLLATGGFVVIVNWSRDMGGYEREIARLEAAGKCKWIKNATVPNLYVGGEAVIYNLHIC